MTADLEKSSLTVNGRPSTVNPSFDCPRSTVRGQLPAAFVAPFVPMNRWRIIGLLLLATFAGWLGLRGCAPEEPSGPAPTPVRDQFHASRPLNVRVVHAEVDQGELPIDTAWLTRELRYLLIRGQMRVATIEPDARPSYTLRVMVPRTAGEPAMLELVAPDGIVDKKQALSFGTDSLSTMQAFADILPAFLGSTRSSAEWQQALGTSDGNAYETFLGSTDELFGPEGLGFTQPLVADSSETLNRLEALTRKQPEFARAWAALSVAYMTLGGEDEASLTKLASTAAERALALDAALTDAQSTQGLVRLRRGEWVAAKEYFETALGVDPNAPAALEGLACLLVDVGHSSAALPIAQRAALVQPSSIGAIECLIYARMATGTAGTSANPEAEPLAIAQVKALDALLAGEIETAEDVLRSATNTPNAAVWIEPLLGAANNRERTSGALRAITRAASDRLIDPATELVCGAALRQSEFVFNRMLRLEKQGEAVPLRILWLPRTAFLREHPRFEEIVSAEGLPSFWQEHGPADICATEQGVYGCGAKAPAAPP